MPEMEKIQALADENGIHLIEDAAEALGLLSKDTGWEVWSGCRP